MVRQRVRRNEGSRGAPAGSTRQSSRLKDCSHAPIIFLSGRKFGLYQHLLAALEHAPIRFTFILAFMGAQTDTLKWRHNSCSLYIDYGASDHSSNLERGHARAMDELAGLETFVSFCFRFLMFVYQVKKQYSTANTVLLLPLTTKNSTVLLLPNQHKNKQQYNSTTIHDLNLQ